MRMFDYENVYENMFNKILNMRVGLNKIDRLVNHILRLNFKSLDFGLMVIILLLFKKNEYFI